MIDYNRNREMVDHLRQRNLPQEDWEHRSRSEEVFDKYIFRIILLLVLGYALYHTWLYYFGG